MSEPTKREAAKRRWEKATPEQRSRNTQAGARVYRINAAKRRIEKAYQQIENDRVLIAELEAEEEQ